MLYKLLRLLGFKTFDELMEDVDAGKRGGFNDRDAARARALERAALPRGVYYPLAGDVFESRSNVEIDYLTSWAAPYTGGGRTMLPKGERVIVQQVGLPKPTSVYCLPDRYDELHDRIVPESDRSAEKYGGYYFSIKTKLLNEQFAKIDA